jgi:hypothetical protein
MPSKLVWRRCGTCGQLTLVPATANVCWQCGSPLVDGPGGDNNPLADRALPGQAPGFGPFGGDAPRPFGGFAPADASLPPPKPRPMDLTPEEDARARRLLASVFPDGGIAL